VLIVIETVQQGLQSVEYFAKTSSRRDDKVTLLLLEAENRSLTQKVFRRHNSSPSAVTLSSRSRSRTNSSNHSQDEELLAKHMIHIKPRQEHSYENVMYFKELEGLLLFNRGGVPPKSINWEVLNYDNLSLHSRNTNLLQYVKGAKFGLIITASDGAERETLSLPTQLLSHTKTPIMVVPMDLSQKIKDNYPQSKVYVLPQNTDSRMFNEVMKEMHVNVGADDIPNEVEEMPMLKSELARMESISSSFRRFGYSAPQIGRIPSGNNPFMASTGHMQVSDEVPEEEVEQEEPEEEPYLLITMNGVPIDQMEQDENGLWVRKENVPQQPQRKPKPKPVQPHTSVAPKADAAMVSWVRELINPSPMLAANTGAPYVPTKIHTGRIDDTIKIPEIKPAVSRPKLVSKVTKVTKATKTPVEEKAKAKTAPPAKPQNGEANQKVNGKKSADAYRSRNLDSGMNQRGGRYAPVVTHSLQRPVK